MLSTHIWFQINRHEKNRSQIGNKKRNETRYYNFVAYYLLKANKNILRRSILLNPISVITNK